MKAKHSVPEREWSASNIARWCERRMRKNPNLRLETPKPAPPPIPSRGRVHAAPSQAPPAPLGRYHASPERARSRRYHALSSHKRACGGHERALSRPEHGLGGLQRALGGHERALSGHKRALSAHECARGACGRGGDPHPTMRHNARDPTTASAPNRKHGRPNSAAGACKANRPALGNRKTSGHHATNRHGETKRPGLCPTTPVIDEPNTRRHILSHLGAARLGNPANRHTPGAGRGSALVRVGTLFHGTHHGRTTT